MTLEQKMKLELEFEELSFRLIKLSLFIKENPIFSTLSLEEQSMILTQESVMRTYKQSLLNRIMTNGGFHWAVDYNITSKNQSYAKN